VLTIRYPLRLQDGFNPQTPVRGCIETFGANTQERCLHAISPSQAPTDARCIRTKKTSEDSPLLSTYKYDDLIGIPFVYGGRAATKEQGLDCYGVIEEMYLRAHGVQIPEQLSASNKAHIAVMMGVHKSKWSRTQERVGSVVLFNLYGLSCHVGFVISGNLFIHTWEKSGGVCVERLDKWAKRIEGYYRYE